MTKNEMGNKSNSPGAYTVCVFLAPPRSREDGKQERGRPCREGPPATGTKQRGPQTGKGERINESQKGNRKFTRAYMRLK